MSDFLSRLAGSVLVPHAGVRPRLPALFEPPPYQSAAGDFGETPPVEQGVEPVWERPGKPVRTHAAETLAEEVLEAPAVSLPEDERGAADERRSFADRPTPVYRGRDGPRRPERYEAIPQERHGPPEVVSAVGVPAPANPRDVPVTGIPAVVAVEGRPEAAETLGVSPPHRGLVSLPPAAREEGRNTLFAVEYRAAGDVGSTANEPDAVEPGASSRTHLAETLPDARPAKAQTRLHAPSGTMHAAVPTGGVAAHTSPGEAPAIRVSIGRIEVRAVTGAPAPPLPRPATQPKDSLQDYLKRPKGAKP